MPGLEGPLQACFWPLGAHGCPGGHSPRAGRRAGAPPGSCLCRKNQRRAGPRPECRLTGMFLACATERLGGARSFHDGRAGPSTPPAPSSLDSPLTLLGRDPRALLPSRCIRVTSTPLQSRGCSWTTPDPHPATGPSGAPSAGPTRWAGAPVVLPEGRKVSGSIWSLPDAGRGAGGSF